MSFIILCIYLASVMESLQILSVVIGIGCIFIIVKSIKHYFSYLATFKSKSLAKKLFKYSYKLLLICMLVFIVTPSKQEVYIMTGLKVSNEVMQSETGTKALKLLNLKLDEYLNESQKEVNNEKQ